MTVLLTGASGLLGSHLRATTPDDVALTSVVHRTPIEDPSRVVVDLRDPDAVRAAFLDVSPAVVVHVAYAKDRAPIVEATTNVVDAADAVGAAVVFVSTDAVFSGDGRVRAEDDEPDPVHDYGRWKAEAEQLVLARSGHSAVVRLPLLCSVDPPDHIVRALASPDAPTWFVDEFRQPAWAIDIARALWRIVRLDGDRRAGIWHLPGAERLDRYELALRLAKAAEVDADRVQPGELPSGSDRPRDIVLGAARAERELAWQPSSI